MGFIVENFIIGFDKVGVDFFNIKEFVVLEKERSCFEVKLSSTKEFGSNRDYTRDIKRFGKTQKIDLIRKILEEIIGLKKDIEVLQNITEDVILSEKFNSRILKHHDLRFKLEDNPLFESLFLNISFENHLFIFDKENITIYLEFNFEDKDDTLNVDIEALVCIENIDEIKIYKLENYIPENSKRLVV
ncbi:MAG: hypothetical protein PF569_01020 [Candidatus Woesearchaeota archaeon]|jgi:hypothetical protein|nr:hypothetical protein [Candidatus Woesearchaeota archaeon]